MTAPIKVVAVFPAFAVAVNELAMVWQRLTDAGLVELRVLAGAGDALKNVQADLGIERHPGLEIRRVPGALAPGVLDEASVRWAAEFRPDLIVSQLQVNLPHARRIAALCGAPILLHAEFWVDPAVLTRRQYGGVPALAPLANALQRRRWGRGLSGVMVSNPSERHDPDATPPSWFLPWPHPPSPLPRLAREERPPHTLGYVGSISGWKGAARLARAIDAALEQLPELRVELVGPATDDTGRHALQRLARWRASGRLVHHERLPRPEALALIGRVQAVYAPADSMGWGLIGDAWGRGTPVIAARPHYGVEHGRNGLVAGHARAFVEVLRSLQADAALWERLSAAGLRRFEQHGVERVAETLLGILRRCTAPVPRGGAAVPADENGR